MKANQTTQTELADLQAKAITALRENRPSEPPLLFFLNPIVEWCEAQHIALLKAGRFKDIRRAFNPVFIHLPAEGCRLTELAARAHMTKQAMAELVEELVNLGYLVRFTDPNDGRAKIILRTEKGLKAHEATLAAFAQIEHTLADLIGAQGQAELRSALSRVKLAIKETA